MLNPADSNAVPNSQPTVGDKVLLILQLAGNVPVEKSSKRRVVCAVLLIDEIKRRRKITLFMEIIFTNIRFAS